ncbi:MAG: hypothetical protein IPK72_10565 [Candidatus Eisenbacteria bacterium]|nr:hypothetical protein [Candidatus Eisenbacteria bacterium]
MTRHRTRSARFLLQLLCLTLLFLGVGTGVRSGWSAAPADSSAAPGVVVPQRLIVYYFHTSQRCVSCRKLEAFTAEAMQTRFATELAAGRVDFRIVNYEREENAHFAKEYKLYTKSVVVVDERNGAEVAWKNLPKVWQLLHDKGKFIEYVAGEARAVLMEQSS